MYQKYLVQKTAFSVAEGRKNAMYQMYQLFCRSKSAPRNRARASERGGARALAQGRLVYILWYIWYIVEKHP